MGRGTLKLDEALRRAAREGQNVYQERNGGYLVAAQAPVWLEGDLWADAESVREAVEETDGNMFLAGETLSMAYTARQR